MMPAKMTNSGLLQVNVFSNKGYDFIIPVNDVAAKFYHVIQIIL